MATATLDTTPVAELPDEQIDRAGIPRANIRQAEGAFPEDEWLNVPNVPVFSEHSTRTKKGRRLTFGRNELAVVAANCNRRIRQTGDYAGLVIGHTPDPERVPHSPPMPLIGLAGPFRVGLIQHGRERPQWSILADLHIRREHANALQEYPRRSAELWIADSYDEMHLDPIALLGAEAPRLDMGLLYSSVRGADGREVERYSAACAPGPTNVFVPSDDTAKPEANEDYSAADSEAASPPSTHERTEMPLSPEDIKQIVDALEQTDVFQWARSQMKASAPAVEPEVEANSAEGAPPAGELQPEAAAAEAPPAEAAPPAAPPAAEAAPPAPPPAEDDNLPMKYSRLASQVTGLQDTVQSLRTQLDTERGKRIDTERYAGLVEARRTRQFDLDAEFEICRYARMPKDEAYRGHLDRIYANYRPIPVDTELPVFDGPGARSADRPGAAAEKQRYSKEAADKALQICKAKMRKGEKASYEEVLEQVADGKL